MSVTHALSVVLLVSIGLLSGVTNLSAQQPMPRPRAGAPAQGSFGVPTPPSPPSPGDPAAPPTTPEADQPCTKVVAASETEEALKAGDACVAHLRRGLEAAIGTSGIVQGVSSDAKVRAAAKRIEGRLRKAHRDISLADNEEKWAATMRLGSSAIADLEDLAKNSGSAPGDTGFAARQQQLPTLGELLRAQISKGPPPRNRVTRSAEFIPSAGVSAGTVAPEVALQAAEFYFTNRWRLYIRSTLPTTSDEGEDTEEEADDSAAPGEAEEAEPAAAVDEAVKSALLDPAGGLLNLSTGYFRKLPSPFLFGEANDAEHGLFLDVRGGLRFIELPEQTLKLKDGTGSFTPFYSGSVGVRLILPVFSDPRLSEHAGGVEGHVGYLVNRVADTSASALFTGIDGADPVLKKTTHSIYASAAISLTKVANIAVSGTVWANTKFDRRVVVTLNLVKPDDPAERKEQ
jgi:hypothetical protein